VEGRVLVVEDDRTVRETATLLMERAGLRVTAVDDGQKAVDTIVRDHFDLILLDVMLPSLDGFQVCRIIRQDSQVPIVMLTARARTADTVTGLELGADDYVTKPFNGAELIARVRAALRRRIDETGPPVVSISDLNIDTSSLLVTQEGRSIDLTATEFRLLVELVRSPGGVKSREVLLERVWGYDYLGDSRLVDMAVKRLRDKLDDDARCPRYIATVRGVGYRFEAA